MRVQKRIVLEFNRLLLLESEHSSRFWLTARVERRNPRIFGDDSRDNQNRQEDE